MWLLSPNIRYDSLKVQNSDYLRHLHLGWGPTTEFFRCKHLVKIFTSIYQKQVSLLHWNERRNSKSVLCLTVSDCREINTKVEPVLVSHCNSRPLIICGHVFKYIYRSDTTLLRQFTIVFLLNYKWPYKTGKAVENINCCPIGYHWEFKKDNYTHVRKPCLIITQHITNTNIPRNQ